jgi:hypothetical protein
LLEVGLAKTRADNSLFIVLTTFYSLLSTHYLLAEGLN